jgi:5-methylcytosine-specific restriction endonuclease McrA
MTVVSFDDVSSFVICLPCFRESRPLDPAQETASIRGSRVRRQRRTLNGTVAALPARTYEEVRASGACVYCGARADAADHVYPLSRGGLDVRENLAPACKPCNRSKKDRLLTEWDAARVARAVVISPAVAAEMERLTT